MSRALDKFISEYEAEGDIRKRLDILFEFVNIYYDSDYEKVNAIFEKDLDICVQNNLIDGEALIRFMLAYSWFERGELKKGNDEVQRVMAIFDKVQSHEVRSQILNFMAFTHSHQGNFELAFKSVYECIRESELSSKNVNQFWGLYTLGSFNFDLKDYDNAIKCYSQAVDGFRSVGNGYGIARSETGLSSVCIQQEKFDEAEALLQRSLAHYREIEVYSGQSRSLNDLGVIFKKTGQYEGALDYFKQALGIRREARHMQGIATSLNEIAELLLILKKYDEAEVYLHEAKLACEKVNNRSKLYRTHLMFSRLYKSINNPLKALEHYERYDQLKSDVLGEAANNKIKELQTRMATEKADREAEIERLRNVELKSAYDTIELKNKEITDSIHYAQRIQKALLASDNLLKRNLKDFFVLYQPKDIVSGDFYWATEKDERFYLAVCDSTGHGVPGAFMSLLNISFLNEAITEKQISSPNLVFDHARNRLIENFSLEGGQDGMDGVLVSFDNTKVTYSAAHNPPVFVRNGVLKILDSDKMPVGKGEREIPFTEHQIDLIKDDIIYLITDGFADQFGGPKGKKFKKKNLILFLEKIKDLPMDIQKQQLLAAFNVWKGNLEQVDDVLLVGIKI
ncbi:MAG: tetratricopeptide repeat protein [Bacteroidetes bacterium]|nr:MAG: tetratricopeptide repeat protein [Bacteroidota bacterium]